MNTETHPDPAQDTTPTAPSESRPRNKRNARHKSQGAQRSATTTPLTVNQGGFEVPIGDSGEVVQSVWHFGG